MLDLKQNIMLNDMKETVSGCCFSERSVHAMTVEASEKFLSSRSLLSSS